ncbi:hypothetical protein LDENG_00165900 [Lucifuga dentata]|nr:hypothetical protein LDENG_00165900 [Lucifuga dentata]
MERFVWENKVVKLDEKSLGRQNRDCLIIPTDGSAILVSPALPVTTGDAVTLLCRCRVTSSSCSFAADFYKDGVLVRSSATAEFNIRAVSTSDEGFYRCNMSGAAGSAGSWLAVTAPPAGQDDFLSVSRLICHLAVGVPYLLSTVMLGLIYRDRKRGESQLLIRREGGKEEKRRSSSSLKRTRKSMEGAEPREDVIVASRVTEEETPTNANNSN